MSLNHINRQPIKAKHCVTVDMKQQSFIPEGRVCNVILVYKARKKKKENKPAIYTTECLQIQSINIRMIGLMCLLLFMNTHIQWICAKVDSINIGWGSVRFIYASNVTCSFHVKRYPYLIKTRITTYEVEFRKEFNSVAEKLMRFFLSFEKKKNERTNERHVSNDEFYENGRNELQNYVSN